MPRHFKRLAVAIFASTLACSNEALLPPPPPWEDCLRAREAIIAKILDPSFDTDSALADLRARADTLAQPFSIVYREGPTESDFARFRGWGAHVFQPYPEEPWLEVRMTLRQAEVIADNPRVQRVLPGVLYVSCPGL